MAYKVSEVAKIAHVSVRTLHHYDAVGIFVPSERNEAGYRLYTDADLAKLQQILFYRELGFTLEEIGELMSNPELDQGDALRAQRELILEQQRRLVAMLGQIDRTLNKLEGETAMTNEEMFEVFGKFNPKDYEDEAKQRWGDTDAYRESARRTKSYTKEDWKRYASENDAVQRQIASLMDQGVKPTDARAIDAAEQHRLLIDKWFYPCSRAMHAGLGKMYVNDPRFTASLDKVHPGMAQYLCDAIAANAKRGK